MRYGLTDIISEADLVRKVMEYQVEDNLNRFATDINVATKTMGDKIRESNESLASYA